jgi:FkbH-like protein
VAATSLTKIIQHVLVPPCWHLRGMADRLSPESAQSQVQSISEGLFAAGVGRVAWVETDALAARLGLENFADESAYLTARLPFAIRYLPEYIFAFRATWRAASARAKKVLVLDLDNTLWGGVIGDDGVSGIVLGPGTPAGEAYVAWAMYIKQLAARGVILAVCSKNNLAIAASGFEHPHSVLKRSDFAAFECSWRDKASGIQRIARDLNVAIDSLVFADDNPAECEQVRQALDNVGVVHLGDDPALFIRRFDAGQWFDIPQYTNEDLNRGVSYEALARARHERAEAHDISTYLTGLNMRGRLETAVGTELERLAQMEQKTNQFNLMTRRYQKRDIAAYMAANDAWVLTLHLRDKYADHGLVSYLIAVQEGDTIRIDNWLMSCRVFSRTAEHFMLLGLIERARDRGVYTLIGEYRPTTKNHVVADLYERLGFKSFDATAGTWYLDISTGVAGLKHFIARQELASDASILA